MWVSFMYLNAHMCGGKRPFKANDVFKWASIIYLPYGSHWDAVVQLIPSLIPAMKNVDDSANAILRRLPLDSLGNN